jgi:hypothetical protein
MTQLKERNESPKEDPENGISDMGVSLVGVSPPNFYELPHAPALGYVLESGQYWLIIMV